MDAVENYAFYLSYERKFISMKSWSERHKKYFKLMICVSKFMNKTFLIDQWFDISTGIKWWFPHEETQYFSQSRKTSIWERTDEKLWTLRMTKHRNGDSLCKNHKIISGNLNVHFHEPLFLIMLLSQTYTNSVQLGFVLHWMDTWQRDSFVYIFSMLFVFLCCDEN